MNDSLEKIENESKRKKKLIWCYIGETISEALTKIFGFVLSLEQESNNNNNNL